ncbi:MAG: Ig-like domain-containing protein [Candidatus Eremiobacteraeota bacterium]|nr:Ig-like domain-containing protein [Candidatus Eremiobacteraeota bacterium]
MSHYSKILLAILVSFFVGCGNSDNFVFTNGAQSTPTQLNFISQPMRAGDALDTFQVGVFDANNNLVDVSGIEITLTSPNATLTGDTTELTQNGIAFFDNVIITSAGTDFVLQANAEGLDGAISQVFSVDPADPALLSFSIQPVPVSVDEPTRFTVLLTDEFGNGVPNQAVSVSVLDTNTTNPVTFGGTSNATTGADGTASFDDITVDTAGSYQVRATVAGLSQDSVPFGVGLVAYLRSTVQQPWDNNTIEDAMDAAFGTGEWSDLRYETFDISDLNLYRFVYFEGSDETADELEAFLDTNRAAIESYVTNGGRLFVNAAPNEGDGMLFPFNVQLTYVEEDTAADEVTAVDPTNPLFSGIATTYTGTDFSHAIVGPTGLVGLIETVTGGDDIVGGELVAAQAVQGLGFIVYGAMTTDNYHSPQPDAATLRANFIRYTSQGGTIAP